MNVRESASSQSERGMLLLALSMLVLLTLVAIFLRPMTPIDETRYVGVAWEMWLRGDFLVPFKNGAPYSHKPPLMIWMFQAGWAVFGVNEWWPRLVSPLVSAANLLLTLALARRLWPGRVKVGGPAVLVLASCLLWTFFSTAAMFDILLALFTLIGMHGTLIAAEGNGKRGFALLGLAIGLGVLTKGPVILLHVLPAALLAPWWNPGLRWSHWFGGILVAILLGAAIALSWAIPAGLAGGEEYRQAIFFGQTVNRMVESFAHRRPLWWYLPLLPLLFFPWLLWPGLWRALSHYVRRELDRGGRFCLAWMLPVLVAFSFISGKQPHYLIPLFPAFALLAARAMAKEQQMKGLWLPSLGVLALGIVLLAMARGWIGSPLGGVELPEAWPGLLLMLAAVGFYLLGRRLAKPLAQLAALGAAVSALLQLALIGPVYPAYDVHPMAMAIKQAQDSGHLVAHHGEYHDQYHFAGRLQAPLILIDDNEALKTWLSEHPEGNVVLYPKDIKRLEGIRVIASQRYLGGAVALLDAQSALTVLATPKVLD
ncbi:ArnT family glycosyltransferase [Propionivibrio sp.]|uniref:ArnT family glycosyltransferase n=1 Tax=Propionivibrio sp. TaxID=2212460 RepID=UPI003BF4036C